MNYIEKFLDSWSLHYPITSYKTDYCLFQWKNDKVILSCYITPTSEFSEYANLEIYIKFADFSGIYSIKQTASSSPIADLISLIENTASVIPLVAGVICTNQKKE